MLWNHRMPSQSNLAMISYIWSAMFKKNGLAFQSELIWIIDPCPFVWFLFFWNAGIKGTWKANSVIQTTLPVAWNEETVKAKAKPVWSSV